MKWSRNHFDDKVERLRFKMFNCLMFNSLKCAVVIERNEMEPKSHSEVEITLRFCNSSNSATLQISNSAIQQIINSANHQLSNPSNIQPIIGFKY
jgi:hypothetical protein